MKRNAFKGVFESMAFVALAFIAVVPAKADLVNGNFTQGAYIASGPGYETLSAGSMDLTGWTIVSGSVDWIQGYWQVPPSGGFSLDMDGTTPGTISQAVATTIGKTYDLSFSLSGNPDGGPTTKVLQITSDAISSPVTNYMYVVGGNSTGSMNWIGESYVFTATAATTTLTFASQDSPSNNPYGPALGALNLQATPEPGFYGVLALGLAGLAFAAARRRLA